MKRIITWQRRNNDNDVHDSQRQKAEEGEDRASIGTVSAAVAMALDPVAVMWREEAEATQNKYVSFETEKSGLTNSNTTLTKEREDKYDEEWCDIPYQQDWKENDRKPL